MSHAVGEPHPRVSATDRIGSFRYFLADDRWEWSDAVARLHGYTPGQVQPDTAIVMSHKHPDDAPDVAALIERMNGNGEPFSSRHRIIDTSGATRVVLVVGDRMTDEDGTVLGTTGFYVDLTDFDDSGSINAAVAEFEAHRTVIEQAKGMLMMIYQLPAHRAFDILAWRSQETNVKLRDIAVQLVTDLTSGLDVTENLREKADHALLTTHHRIAGAAEQREERTAS